MKFSKYLLYEDNKIGTMTMKIPKLRCYYCDMSDQLLFNKIESTDDDKIKISTICNRCNKKFLTVFQQT